MNQRFFVIYAQKRTRKVVFVLLGFAIRAAFNENRSTAFCSFRWFCCALRRKFPQQKIPATRRWRGERETVVEDEFAHGRDETADSNRGVHARRATLRICWKREDREADNQPSPGGGGARSRYNHGDFAVSNRLRPAPMRGGRPYRRCVRGGACIRSTACR